jgi:PAS domain S-box-containing protein
MCLVETRIGDGEAVKPSVRIYGVTLAAVSLALAVRWLLDPMLGDYWPFPTFVVAVAFAAWYGGLRAALLATALGLLLALYFFVPPRFSFVIESPVYVSGLAMYLLVGLAVALFGEAIRTSRRQAELRAEQLRTTLTSIGDAVITTDHAGCIQSMNPVAESLTGWKFDEARGQPLDLVFHIVNGETRRPVKNPATRVASEGAVHTILISKDGTARPIEESVAPIRSKEGQGVGCVLVFRDISERRRMDEQNAGRLRAFRLLAAIVESSDDAIISKSLEGIIQSWNAAAERLFGHTAQQAVGRHISLIIPPERIEEEDRIIAALKAGERIDHYETVRMRNDGERVLVSLTISPIKDDAGQVIGASKIARDITSRRQAEERERQLLAELRKLAADLSEADRRKDEFLATLAHELRNPLAPIRNALQVIQLSTDREAHEQAHAVMQRQLHQMIRLVDDLLDVSRITRGKLELRREQMSLEAVLDSAVETSRPMIEHLGHELTVSMPKEPVIVDADLTRLAQVFSNLLNNSAKYMDRGGHIWLCAERRGNEVEVSVKDSGIGIAPGQLPHIFQLFSQVDSSLDKSQGGLGIGLTLVKRLVEMHGGRIEARSEGLGKGAEFVVRLPVGVGTSQAPVLGGSERPSPSKSSLRILIVDDNRDAADSLRMLLRLGGNDTRVAYDGQEGLQVAGQFRPDVLLLDIGLPGLNGYEACRRIREQAWGKEAVLIAVTGWGQEEDQRRSHEAGFDYHMVKPVDPEALMKLLGELQQMSPRGNGEVSQLDKPVVHS